MVDILAHKLVPHHEVLSAKERDDVLERFKIKPEQLPDISDSDPVVKAIKAKPGDILRIIRNSQTAKETVYFRRVIKA